jgi:hypothetical protein
MALSGSGGQGRGADEEVVDVKSDLPPADITDAYSEETTHSFVIRIWLDSPAESSRHPVWRGHITHVPSGKRAYFADPDQIVAFIFPYLGGDRRPSPSRWRLPDWLARRDR